MIKKIFKISFVLLFALLFSSLFSMKEKITLKGETKNKAALFKSGSSQNFTPGQIKIWDYHYLKTSFHSVPLKYNRPIIYKPSFDNMFNNNSNFFTKHSFNVSVGNESKQVVADNDGVRWGNKWDSNYFENYGNVKTTSMPKWLQILYKQPKTNEKFYKFNITSKAYENLFKCYKAVYANKKDAEDYQSKIFDMFKHHFNDKSKYDLITLDIDFFHYTKSGDTSWAPAEKYHRQKNFEKQKEESIKYFFNNTLKRSPLKPDYKILLLHISSLRSFDYWSKWPYEKYNDFKQNMYTTKEISISYNGEYAPFNINTYLRKEPTLPNKSYTWYDNEFSVVNEYKQMPNKKLDSNNMQQHIVKFNKDHKKKFDYIDEDAYNEAAKYEDNLTVTIDANHNNKNYNGEAEWYSKYHNNNIPIYNYSNFTSLNNNELHLYYNTEGEPYFYWNKEDLNAAKKERIKNNIKYINSLAPQAVKNILQKSQDDSTLSTELEEIKNSGYSSNDIKEYIESFLNWDLIFVQYRYDTNGFPIINSSYEEPLKISDAYWLKVKIKLQSVSENETYTLKDYDSKKIPLSTKDAIKNFLERTYNEKIKITFNLSFAKKAEEHNITNSEFKETNNNIYSFETIIKPTPKKTISLINQANSVYNFLSKEKEYATSVNNKQIKSFVAGVNSQYPVFFKIDHYKTANEFKNGTPSSTLYFSQKQINFTLENGIYEVDCISLVFENNNIYSKSLSNNVNKRYLIYSFCNDINDPDSKPGESSNQYKLEYVYKSLMDKSGQTYESLDGVQVIINDLFFPSQYGDIKVKLKEQNSSSFKTLEKDNKKQDIDKDIRKLFFNVSGTYQITSYNSMNGERFSPFEFKITIGAPQVLVYRTDLSKSLLVNNIENTIYVAKGLYVSWSEVFTQYRATLYKEEWNAKSKKYEYIMQGEVGSYEKNRTIYEQGNYKIEVYLVTDISTKTIVFFSIDNRVPDIKVYEKKKDKLEDIDYKVSGKYKTKNNFYIDYDGVNKNLPITLKISFTSYTNGIKIEEVRNYKNLKEFNKEIPINTFPIFKNNPNGEYEITITTAYETFSVENVIFDNRKPKITLLSNNKELINKKPFENYFCYYANENVEISYDKYTEIYKIYLDNVETKSTHYVLFRNKPGLYKVVVINDLKVENEVYVYIRNRISNRIIEINDKTYIHSDSNKYPYFCSTETEPFITNQDVLLKWFENDYLKSVEIYTYRYVNNELKKTLIKRLTHNEVFEYKITKENKYIIEYYDLFGNYYILHIDIDKTPLVFEKHGLNDNDKAFTYVWFAWENQEGSENYEDGAYALFYKKHSDGTDLTEEECEKAISKYRNKSKIYEKGFYKVLFYDKAGNETIVEFEINDDPIFFELYEINDNEENKQIFDTNILTNKKLLLNVNLLVYKYIVNDEFIGDNFIFDKEGNYKIKITNSYGNHIELEITIDLTPPSFDIIGLNKYNKSSGTVRFEVNENDFAFLNGRKYESKNPIKNENTYIFEVYDKAGNISSIEFEISKQSSPIVIKDKISKEIIKEDKYNTHCVINNDFQSIYLNDTLITDDLISINTPGIHKIKVINKFDVESERVIELKFAFDTEIKTNLLNDKTNESIFFSFPENVKAILNNREYFTDSKIKSPGLNKIMFTDDFGNTKEYNFEQRFEFKEDIETNLDNSKSNKQIFFKFKTGVKAIIDNKEYLNEQFIDSPGIHKIKFTDEFGNMLEKTFELKFIFDNEIKTNLEQEKSNKQIKFEYDENIITAKLNNKKYVQGSNINKTGVYRLVLTDDFGNTKEYNFELCFEIKPPIILEQETNKKNEVSFKKHQFESKNQIFSEGFKIENISPETKVIVNDVLYENDKMFLDEGEYKITISDNFGNLETNTFTIKHPTVKPDKSYIANNFAIAIITLGVLGLFTVGFILWFKQRKNMKLKIKNNRRRK